MDNNVLQEIINKHKDYLVGYYYDADKSKLSKSLRIICIDKKNLNLEINGRISFYKENLEFIQVYDLISRKNLVVYFNKYYFFTQKYKTKRDKMNDELKKILSRE